MTENVIDQTTSAAPADQPSAAAVDRPAAPQGSVYLSDVLASVRRHANDNGWCSTAESITTQVLNDGLSFKPVRCTTDEECDSPSCDLSHHEDAALTHPDLADERFTPAEGVDPFVTKARLKKAIRKAYDLDFGWGEYRRLYDELIDTYELDEVPLPVLQYTVTFTVTDEQLRGRTADEDGMAYALHAGVTTGFTVTTEPTEQVTPTL